MSETSKGYFLNIMIALYSNALYLGKTKTTQQGKLARWISYVVLQQICHRTDKNVDDIDCNETMRQLELFVMVIKIKK